MKIFLVSGEPSGDRYAAELKRALLELRPDIEFRELRGNERTAVIGFAAVLRNAPFFLRLLRDTKREIAAWKPDILLTVDYPGFNLRLARWAHSRGIKTVHYICPQVWIWHRRRIWSIARDIDRLLCIFPFEPDCFAPTKLRPAFCGHPLAAFSAAKEKNAAENRTVALLPGSRKAEIESLLPIMIDAAKKVRGKNKFIIPAANESARRLIEGIVRGMPEFEVSSLPARVILENARAAAVASGTATLEAALARCPTVLVYKTSLFTELIARFVLRKVKFIGIANLIMKREIMPELLQRACTAENISASLERYLDDAQARACAERDFSELAELLSANSADPFANAAREVLGAGA